MLSKAAEQLEALHALMKREDVNLIVNAYDAGREGEGRGQKGEVNAETARAMVARGRQRRKALRH